jgi:type IV secretion system protein VirB5
MNRRQCDQGTPLNGEQMSKVREDAADPRYLAARREWLERYGDCIAQARNWRLAAILALALAGGALAGLVMLANQNRVVPYIVKVDKLGAAIAVERADIAAEPDEAIIKAQLARWVTSTRTVYVDAAAQRKLITEAYGMINRLGAAYAALNDHMRAHDPFRRAKTETVSVEVQSVLPLAGKSWRLEWSEEVRSRDGGRVGATHYQATVNISFNPPTDEETLRLNPSGLYINDFHWAKRL